MPLPLAKIVAGHPNKNKAFLLEPTSSIVYMALGVTF
jgi:hypothetical protein